MTADDEKKKRQEANRRRLEAAILPTGSGMGRAWTERRISWAPHTIPDWEFWCDMPQVEHWEACALSLNIEPKSLKFSNDGMGAMGSGNHIVMRSFPGEEAWEKYNKRLELLGAHRPDRHHVSLSEFVTWALSRRTPWDMPPELCVLTRDLNVCSGVSEDAGRSDEQHHHRRSVKHGNVSPNDSEAVPIEDWKMKVQAEAAKRWSQYRKQYCNPTAHSLKDELAKWCRDNNIRTKSGINPNAEYLYRHVLSSRHWTPPGD